MNVKNYLGLVHIYCGKGKGKTTAAIGLAIRALGCGLKVVIVQFLKNGRSSEVKILENFNNVQYLANKKIKGSCFNMRGEDIELSRNSHRENFDKAALFCEEGCCDVLILDEVIGAIGRDLFSEELLLNWLKKRPLNVEVILTGQNPSEKLICAADYVSKIEKIKHPYDNGVKARFGVEK